LAIKFPAHANFDQPLTEKISDARGKRMDQTFLSPSASTLVQEATNAAEQFVAMTKAHSRCRFFVGVSRGIVNGIIYGWLLRKLGFPEQDVRETAAEKCKELQSISEKLPPGKQRLLVADFARVAGATYFIQKARACVALYDECFEVSQGTVWRHDLIGDAKSALGQAVRLGGFDEAAKKQVWANFKKCHGLPSAPIDVLEKKQRDLEKALCAPLAPVH
jgi:hypothetical protein